jgi:hypothetical protein
MYYKVVRGFMGLSRKEIKRSKEELKELIKNTDDIELKKDYLYYLYQVDSLNEDDDEIHLKSYSKRLHELERLYQENKDLFQVIIDYNNNISSELDNLKYINDNYDELKESFTRYGFTKKQSIALTRNFYHNIDPHFIDIVDDILDKDTLIMKKKISNDCVGMNYFIGGINKNYIDVKKKGNYTDYFTLVHEFGHAINNIYNPKAYYELNYFDEVVSLFMELVAIYEGRNIFNENLLLYENADNLVFYYDLINSFYKQHQLIDIIYLSQTHKFNKQFIKEVEKRLDYKKKDIKEIIDVSFYLEGNYAISYIMALELLYIYKHNKKEAIELLKELMYKLPLNNQVSEISKYLKPNIHANEETKEIIDKANHVLKKTLKN